MSIISKHTNRLLLSH